MCDVAAMELLVDEVEGTIFLDGRRYAEVHDLDGTFVVNFLQGGMIALDAEDQAEAIEDATEIAVEAFA
jgi:hypothetical protein